MKPRLLAAGAVVLLGLAAGCSDDRSGGEGSESVADGDDGAPTVEVTEDGSCTLAGGEVAAGLVDVEITNNSSKAIELNFLLIVEGDTIDDVIAAAASADDLDAFQHLPSFAAFAQIVRPTDPGVMANVAVTLTTPGDYAVACALTEPPVGVPTVAGAALRVVDG